METYSEYKEINFKDMKKRQSHPAGNVLAGILLIAVGSILLFHKAGFAFPTWFFTGPTLLIVIGLFFGAKKLFRVGGWLIPVILGVGFLAERSFPELAISQFIWPVLIIMAGVALMLGSRRRWRKKKWKNWGASAEEDVDYLDEDTIQSTNVFGGVKKNVISKNFKGGEIICVFGGAEINLGQSDIQGKVELELVQVFGGAKLFVPSNWTVMSELTSVMGGVEDNRFIQEGAEDQNKVLILSGTAVFGGVEITNA